MSDRGGIVFKFESNSISKRDAVFHIKEKFLHHFQPWLVLVASQFFSEQDSHRYGNLSMLIALGVWRESATMAQDVALFLDELFQTVKRVIWRRDSGFRNDTPPPGQAGALSALSHR